MTQKQKYPSHTELYRDLHFFEEYVFSYIFHYFNWHYQNPNDLEQVLDCNIELEVDNWDLCIYINEEYSFDRDLTEELQEIEKQNVQYDLDERFTFYIEYKSSINEWGKQIDEFFRQIKKRINKQEIIGPTILLTFDESFDEYYEACQRAGIELIILPYELWEKVQNFKKVKNKFEDFYDYLDSLEEK